MKRSKSNEPGWILCAMNDPTGRRGIWFRETPEAVELCSGREGDDSFVSIALAEPERSHLLAVLARGESMCSIENVADGFGARPDMSREEALARLAEGDKT